ncbi:MAG: alginate export family protein [Nitrospirae bacterium]|nr:alginate export family protein [Nitrospirota bacterium]
MRIANAYIFAAAFVAALLFAPDFSSYAADAQSGEDTRKYIQSLEKRISDIESLVQKLLKGKEPAAQAPAPKDTIAKEKTKPAADDEWGEPVVSAEAPGGRDPDARRRLTELETWKRKQDAKIAKEAEEAADKVKFDFSGKYKLRVNTRSNFNLNNPLQTWQYDNMTYFDQRFQMKIDAEYGPLSTAVVFDKGNFVFDWKEDSEGTLDRLSEFQTVNSALVRELYVQYTSNYVAKVGRQSMIVGNGGIVLEGPVDALKFTHPLGMTPLGRMSATLSYIAIAGGWKNYNNFTYPSGDRTAVLGVANKLDGWLLSFNIKPKKDLTIEPYILKVFDRGKSDSPDLNLDKDFNASTTPRDGSFEPTWIGIAGHGKEGNFSYKADLMYLTGSYTKNRDISAYAALLRGDYDFKTVKAGLEFGRGSGNKADDPATEDMKYFSGLFLCKERRKFGNIFSEDIRAGYFLYDSNLANVTFARAIAGFEPVKKLKTNISLAKFWTTESVYKGRGTVSNWWDWSRGAATSTEKTKDIGWEMDMNFDFPIYKRLNGFAEFGYFVPGNVYRRSNGQKADSASEIVLGAEFEF